MEIKSKDEYLEEIKSINTDSPYYINKLGQIFGPKKNLLTPRMGGYKKKYQRFSAKVGGKSKDFYIHRVVLMHYVGHPPNGFECAHLDGNPCNNKLENLKWVTPLENSSHKIKHGTSGKGEKNSMSKITNAQAEEIIKNYKLKSAKEMAHLYGLSQGTVSGIATGRIRPMDKFETLYKINKLSAQQKIKKARDDANKKRKNRACKN